MAGVVHILLGLFGFGERMNFIRIEPVTIWGKIRKYLVDIGVLENKCRNCFFYHPDDNTCSVSFYKIHGKRKYVKVKRDYVCKYFAPND